MSRDKNTDTLSGLAIRLASELEQAIVDRRLNVLTSESLQTVIGALCRLYTANVEAGNTNLPIAPGGKVTSTDVMITAGGLLRASNLGVFELGMWQSWTGR